MIREMSVQFGSCEAPQSWLLDVYVSYPDGVSASIIAKLHRVVYFGACVLVCLLSGYGRRGLVRVRLVIIG